MTQNTERTDTTTDTTEPPIHSLRARARRTTETKEPPYGLDAPREGLIDAALNIAHQDATLRRNLKEVILRDDTAAALEAACALVAVEPSGSILALPCGKAAHPQEESIA